jgi:hypothetical protein
MAPTILGVILYGYYTYSFSINLGGGGDVGVHPQLFLNKKLRKNHFIGTSTIILDTLQRGSLNMLSSPKYYNASSPFICAPLYKLYALKLNHNQNNMGYKMKCYWECLREYIGDLGKTLRA